MLVRSFVADTMPEALAQVRSALGERALLLKAQMATSAKAPRVELTAAADGLTSTRSTAVASLDQQAWSAVRSELARVQARITALETGDPDQRWLAACDLDGGLAKQLLASARGNDDRTSHITAELLKRIRVVPGLLPLPDKPHRIAFVGPAGVGKTTALVKTAAQACSTGRRDVALINLDTYKPGAEDYLAQVGETLQVPVLSDRSPDVQGGLIEAEGLLLIDTDSHMHAADRGSAAARATLGQLRPDVVALVLPATWRTADLMAAVATYQICSPTHLVFSGLDSTIRYGGVLSVAALSKLPVACVLTTGRFETGVRVLQPDWLLQQMKSLYPTDQLPEEVPGD